MDITAYLADHFNLPTDLLEILETSGERIKYTKGTVILEPYRPSSKIYFIEQGFLKMFYHKNGREITHHFLSENKLMTRPENFGGRIRKHDSSVFGLTVLESPTFIFELPFSVVQKQAERSVEMNRVIQQILLDLVQSYSNRLNSLQFESAKERYERLLESAPQTVLRASLGDIASYLGISQQTLSVIRAQIK